MKNTSILALTLSLVGTNAIGATEEEICQDKKLVALGQRELCVRQERGKQIKGKSYNLERCAENFESSLRTAEKSFVCRWLEHGDGTATDLDTGLQWELKTTDASLHDVLGVESWSDTAVLPDGSAYVDFLRSLNGSTSTGETSSGCFVGKCDWRLPTLEELLTIVDHTAPGCREGDPCTTIPGETEPVLYWSSTSWEDPSGSAWGAHFGDGSHGVGTKAVPKAVRAVRGTS